MSWKKTVLNNIPQQYGLKMFLLSTNPIIKVKTDQVLRDDRLNC